MIYITQNSDSGQIHASKHPAGGKPEATGETYAVFPANGQWEVRRIKRAGGKIVDRELVATLPTEQQADRVALQFIQLAADRHRGRPTAAERFV